MVVRFTALIRRKPGMTHQDFRKYWGENHARIFTNLKAVRENIVRYNQFHVLPQASDELAKIGFSVAPFDGAVEFHVEKVEDLLTIFSDEDYLKTSVPDEVNFMDRESVQILVGEDFQKYEKK